MIDFDQVLQRIGSFGRYQKMRFGILNISVMVLYQYTIYSLIFMTYTPPFTCIEYVNGTTPPPGLAKSTGPSPASPNSGLTGQNEDDDSKKTSLNSDQCSFELEDDITGDVKTVECVSWVYEDIDNTTHTVVTEWNLICGRKWIVTIIQALSNTATAFGAIGFALIQDGMGRKLGFFITVVVCVIPGFCMAVFANDVVTFTVLRVIQATMITSGWSFPYILSLEMVGPTERTFVTSVMIAAFSLGATSTAAVAWISRDWRMLALLTSVPFIAFFSYWPLLDESPRWLLTKRKTRELTALVHKIAAVNGTPLDDDEIHHLLLAPMAAMHEKEAEAELLREKSKDDELNHPEDPTIPLEGGAPVWKRMDDIKPTWDEPFSDKASSYSGIPLTPESPAGADAHSVIPTTRIIDENDEENKSTDRGANEPSVNILDLFRNHNIGAKTGIIMFLYIVNAIVYTGLAFNVENLAGNRFTNFAMLMIMELPAGIAINFILDRFGRILPTALMMSLGGTAAVITTVIPTHLPLLIGLMAAAAKFGISGSFAILCQLTGELYPTELRGTGTGLGGFIGSLSMAAVPFIVFSAQADRTLPMVIMGLMSVTGGISVLFLPETLNSFLPETVEDCACTTVGVATAWENVTLRALKRARALASEVAAIDSPKRVSNDHGSPPTAIKLNPGAGGKMGEAPRETVAEIRIPTADNGAEFVLLKSVTYVL